MAALTRLQALDLSNNDCGDEAVECLISQDLASTSLTRLCLASNRLGPGQQQKIDGCGRRRAVCRAS